MELPNSSEYRAKVFEKLKEAPTEGDPRKIAEELMWFERFACCYSICSRICELSANPKDARAKRTLDRLNEEYEEISQATDCIAEIIEMMN